MHGSCVSVWRMRSLLALLLAAMEWTRVNKGCVLRVWNCIKEWELECVEAPAREQCGSADLRRLKNSGLTW